MLPVEEKDMVAAVYGCRVVRRADNRKRPGDLSYVANHLALGDIAGSADDDVDAGKQLCVVFFGDVDGVRPIWGCLALSRLSPARESVCVSTKACDGKCIQNRLPRNG